MDRKQAFEFIRVYRELVKESNFKELYEQFDNITDYVSDTHYLTDIFIEAGIDPLDYIDYVPKDCFFGLDMHGFVLPDHITGIGHFSFAHTANLKTINLKNVNHIDENSFSSSDLETLMIPGSIDVIPPQAFKDCKNLKKVILEEGVEYINDSAFIHCSTLKELYLPSTLVYIHEFAFYGDRYLSDIYYNGTKEAVRKVWTEAMDGLGLNYTIHCTDGDIEK